MNVPSFISFPWFRYLVIKSMPIEHTQFYLFSLVLLTDVQICECTQFYLFSLVPLTGVQIYERTQFYHLFLVLLTGVQIYAN
jgi:hypothetical protein